MLPAGVRSSPASSSLPRASPDRQPPRRDQEQAHGGRGVPGRSPCPGQDRRGRPRQAKARLDKARSDVPPRLTSRSPASRPIGPRRWPAHQDPRPVRRHRARREIDTGTSRRRGRRESCSSSSPDRTSSPSRSASPRPRLPFVNAGDRGTSPPPGPGREDLLREGHPDLLALDARPGRSAPRSTSPARTNSCGPASTPMPPSSPRSTRTPDRAGDRPREGLQTFV